MRYLHMKEQFIPPPRQEEACEEPTRTFAERFTDHADFLQIPPESRAHPLVREFVTFSLRLHELCDDMGIAEARRGGLGTELEAGIEPSLTDRYGRAADLMNAAIVLFLDGLPPDGDADVDY